MADKEIVDLDQANWGSEDFTLNHPFKLAGVAYEKIKYSVPTGRQVYAYYKARDSDYRALAMMVAEVDEKILDAMHGSDFARLILEMGKYASGSL